nr:hypothetical protein [Bacillus pumilus]
MLGEVMLEKRKDGEYGVMGKGWRKGEGVLLGVGIGTGRIGGREVGVVWGGFMEVMGKVM